MLELVYSYFFRLERRRKYLIQIITDVALLTISFVAAMALRLENLDFVFEPKVWTTFFIVLQPTFAVLAKLGFYRAVVRYISDRALRPLATALFLSATLLFIISRTFEVVIPRSVPLIYMILSFLTLGGVRFILRAMHRRRQYRFKKRVAIYGAGASGSQLLVTLRQGTEYAPVAFFDDSPELQGCVLGGIEIYPPSALQELIEVEEIEVVLLAIPSATRTQRKAIIDRLEPFNVRVQTIPGIADLVSGRATVDEIRDVAIEDLLGRDPVEPDQRLLDANIRGKNVLVSGAGGSIGGELCRQIIRQGPETLVLFEVSEFALYSIHQELLDILSDEGLEGKVIPLLGSVQDRSRVEAALRCFHIQTIYHAAAYKHVPMVEHNVVEGVRNNIFGTLTMARAAIDAGVDAFILISTDKAVRPANVMGASKRMTELICQAFSLDNTGTLFSMVRFGNVLGSSGSVIPMFRRQIEAGGPITVTHREITRYFMLIPEAAQLVIQAGALARGGDVFVLDMGEPVRIVDLAERMAKLSGLRPVVVDPSRPNDTGDVQDYGDIQITFSRLRPGEKLYEELLIGDNVKPTSHPRILTATEVALSTSDLMPLLDRIEDICASESLLELRALLQSAPIGYEPSDDVVDYLFVERSRSLDRAETAPAQAALG
jgi:FlaA1/EpsC-like NDP-sugar epimerase